MINAKPYNSIMAVAVAAAMGHMGNSGRGAYGEALDASRIIYGTRERISELVGLGNPKQVAFTSNSTEALNTAILGLFGPGDHVISTVMEHNSVLRPLYRLEKAGMGVSFCPCDEKGRLRTELLSGCCGHSGSVPGFPFCLFPQFFRCNYGVCR